MTCEYIDGILVFEILSRQHFLFRYTKWEAQIEGKNIINFLLVVGSCIFFFLTYASNYSFFRQKADWLIDFRSYKIYFNLHAQKFN